DDAPGNVGGGQWDAECAGQRLEIPPGLSDFYVERDGGFPQLSCLKQISRFGVNFRDMRLSLISKRDGRNSRGAGAFHDSERPNGNRAVEPLFKGKPGGNRYPQDGESRAALEKGPTEHPCQFSFRGWCIRSRPG